LEKTSDLMKGMGSDFTFYGPIFGPYPFTPKFHVFSHGWPSDFKGFVSTAINSLIGAVKEKKALSIVGIKVKEFQLETKWYEEVILANMRKNAYFLRPSRNFCAISNLMVPPTKGVSFVVKDSSYEYGASGAAVDFVQDEDGSEEDDYYPDDEVDNVREEIDQTHGRATHTFTSTFTLDDAGIPDSQDDEDDDGGGDEGEVGLDSPLSQEDGGTENDEDSDEEEEVPLPRKKMTRIATTPASLNLPKITPKQEEVDAPISLVVPTVYVSVPKVMTPDPVMLANSPLPSSSSLSSAPPPPPPPRAPAPSTPKSIMRKTLPRPDERDDALERADDVKEKVKKKQVRMEERKDDGSIDTKVVDINPDDWE